MFKKICIGIAAFSVTACATAPENMNRSLNFAWNLTPETELKQSKTVNHGDIFFGWKAQALQSHAIELNGEVTPLIISETSKGNLYCTGDKVKNLCYEDRNGDNRFDTVWNTYKNPNAPEILVSATSPDELEESIPFSVAKQVDNPVISRNLGLLYNGPRRGEINEQGKFTDYFGEILVGWHNGKTATRSPTGAGWYTANFIFMLFSEDKKFEIDLEELGFRYKALAADVEGGLTLEYQAKSIEGIKLNKKFEIDVVDDEDEDKSGTG